MKVSVIVPVYNSREFVGDCLDSLVNQTLEDIEIIAIDDASTDGSLDVLREYEKKYPGKVKVMANSKNIGQGFTRNRGIEIASGEYIGFIDSDDYINFSMYEKMYNIAKANNDPEVVVTGMAFVRDSRYLKDKFDGIASTKGRIIEVPKMPYLVPDESPSPCNKIFRSDTVKNRMFAESKIWEDVAFTYAKMFSADRVLKFNDVDYFYRKRLDEGVSASGLKPHDNVFDIISVCDSLEKELRENNKFEQYEYYVRFTQIVYSLYRVLEIFAWDIDQKEKDELSKKMLEVIRNKYGDWNRYPKELLSSKIGILELEQINKIVRENHFVL